MVLLFVFALWVLKHKACMNIHRRSIDRTELQKAIAYLDSLEYSDSVKRIHHPSEKVKKSYVEIPRVNGNLALARDFEKIKGIGPVLSKRIVKYRDLLGGFYSVEQLSEVYGIDSEVMEQIRASVVIETFDLVKLSLSTGEFKDLLKHPYLNYQQLVCLRNALKYKDSIDVYLCFEDSALAARFMPYMQNAYGGE